MRINENVLFSILEVKGVDLIVVSITVHHEVFSADSPKHQLVAICATY